MTVVEAALVATGGALGATSRYLVGTLVQPVSESFPVATLTVNVLGSFVLGLVTFLGAGSEIGLFVGIGACGSFTTFSSFSVDAVRLWEGGRPVLAAVHALTNLVLATGAVVAANALVTLS
ncbi:fluoride efflux transporter CrcB [Halalkalicoccus sp. GCM10025322]|uniref:fluoride efflux transporter CrcB n=1 Tax=Halalkalicoccus TaxID=332246 RepID=UPI002F96CA8F